jgi:PAS domain S-box-containing protein
MNARPEEERRLEELRQRIIGLGERSHHKSYYPQLQERIAQLEHAYRTILASEEKFRTLVENLDVGIYRTRFNGDSPIMQANPALARMFGYDDASQLLAVPPGDLYADREERNALLAALQDEGTVHDRRVRMRRRDGTVILCSLTFTAVRGPYGRIEFIDGIVEDITERERSQEELRRSEGRFRSLIESAPVAIAMSREGRTTYGNPRYLRMFGHTDQEELLGRPFIEQVAPQDREKIMEFAGALAGGSPHTEEIEIMGLRRDGSIFPFHAAITGVDLADGPALLGFFTDITERKAAEEALRSSEQMLKIVLDHFPGVVYWKDRNLVYLGGNRESARITGFADPSELVGKTDYDLPWAHTEAKAYRADDRQVIASGQAKLHVIERQLRADGTIGWLDTSKVPLRDQRGKVIGLLGASTDITERKQAETALQDSQHMLQLVLDNVPDRVFWKDRDLNYLGCNQNVARDAGLADPKDIIGKNDRELAWRASADAYRSDDRQVIESGRAKINFEEVQIQTDGSTRWLQTSKVPLRDPEGRIFGLLGTYEDITERKQVEESLRLSEEKFAKAFYGNAAEMMLTRIDDGRIIDVNERWQEVTGYSREEVIGRTTTELNIWGDPEQRAQFIGDLERTGSAHYQEVTFIKKNGEPIIDLLSSHIIAVGEERFILTSTFDITRQKESEAALRRDEARNRVLFELAQRPDLTVSAIAEKAMEFAIELTKSKIGHIAFLDEDEATLTMQHWSKEAMEGCGIEDRSRIYPVASTEPWGEAVRQRRPIIINDHNALAPLRVACPRGPVDLRRHMNVPVFDRGRIVAVAGVGNKDSEYTKGDAAELSLLMDGMWRIIRKIQAEEALRSSEERFRTLAEATFEGIVVHADGIILDVNQAALEQTGYARQEAIGRPITDFFTPDSQELIREVFQQPRVQAYEAHLLTKDGAVRTVQIQGRALGFNGQSTRVATFMDITERVEARRRIEELVARKEDERRRLRTILDTLPVGVVIVDEAGQATENNERAQLIWGPVVQNIPASVEEYGTLTGWWADTGIQLKPEDWTVARAMRENRTIVGDLIDIKRLDGSRGTVFNSAVPLQDRGRVVGGVVVSEDITKQRELEHEAIAAKERAELYIDLLTHDINNMNTGAMGYLQLVEGDPALDERNRQRLMKSQEALDDISGLIGKVKKIQIVEAADARRGLVDLGWTIEDVVCSFKDYPGKEVRINYRPQLQRMVLASELLSDVFTNLIGNAVKHSEGAVAIDVNIGKILEEGREHYLVTVEDDGPGVPDEMKKKIFSRLQRGKTRASGSGLGLYLVKSLVEDFQGRVWVEDRVPGDHTKGAKFVVMLPVAAVPEGAGR